MSDIITHFGKHKGSKITEVPTGYLQWVIAKMDPVLLPQYRFKEDKTPMTVEEVSAAEIANREFIRAAQDEIERRTHHDQS